MTKEEMKKKMIALRRPFKESEIEWRIQSSGIGTNGPYGRCLAYINNRAIQYRLDEVFPFAWQTAEPKELSDGGFLFGIGIKIDDEWIWKWDGAQRTDIEGTKGGISGAMKRAGALWGIGRYLYFLDTGWAEFVKGGKHYAKINNNPYYWNPPALPQWALPKDEQKEEEMIY